MLKIGVFGAGHLGKIHIKCIQLANKHFQLIGFFDPDERTRTLVAEQLNIKAYPSAESLLEEIEVADIVSPTPTHFELAQKALLKGVKVFVEKPITHTLEEAEILVSLSEKLDIPIQVGHVERFNPALLAVGNTPLKPLFIEAHRLAVFNPRGTDVSVVLDLMIHDLDIILSLIPEEIAEIHANGVAVVSNTPDIANARITFSNGSIVNLTASRISMKQMRKMRLFQKDAYIGLDFLDKTAQVIRLQDGAHLSEEELKEEMLLETLQGKKIIKIEEPPIPENNAIQMELESFAESILAGKPPKVSVRDGYKALQLAYLIIDKINRQAVF